MLINNIDNLMYFICFIWYCIIEEGVLEIYNNRIVFIVFYMDDGRGGGGDCSRIWMIFIIDLEIFDF